MCDGFKRSKFYTLSVEANDTRGVPIGTGGCDAVKLSANPYSFNGGTVLNSPLYFYYGDANGQGKIFMVLDRNGNVAYVDTGIIYCQDLSEIFVRFPSAFGHTLEVQVETLYR